MVNSCLDFLPAILGKSGKSEYHIVLKYADFAPGLVYEDHEGNLKPAVCGMLPFTDCCWFLADTTDGKKWISPISGERLDLKAPMLLMLQRRWADETTREYIRNKPQRG